MNIKKLDLIVEENNFDKKILQDITKEVSYENEFIFFGDKNHTDYDKHMDKCEFCADYTDDGHAGVHTDYYNHTDYIDKS